MESDPRYPYTYAADCLRNLVWQHGDGMISRSSASLIRQAISSALDMDDAEVAKKLADHYKSKSGILSD